MWKLCKSFLASTAHYSEVCKRACNKFFPVINTRINEFKDKIDEVMNIPTTELNMFELVNETHLEISSYNPQPKVVSQSSNNYCKNILPNGSHNLELKPKLFKPNMSVVRNTSTEKNNEIKKRPSKHLLEAAKNIKPTLHHQPKKTENFLPEYYSINVAKNIELNNSENMSHISINFNSPDVKESENANFLKENLLSHVFTLNESKVNNNKNILNNAGDHLSKQSIESENLTTTRNVKVELEDEKLKVHKKLESSVYETDLILDKFKGIDSKFNNEKNFKITPQHIDSEKSGAAADSNFEKNSGFSCKKKLYVRNYTTKASSIFFTDCAEVSKPKLTNSRPKDVEVSSDYYQCSNLPDPIADIQNILLFKKKFKFKKRKSQPNVKRQGSSPPAGYDINVKPVSTLKEEVVQRIAAAADDFFSNQPKLKTKENKEELVKILEMNAKAFKKLERKLTSELVAKSDVLKRLENLKNYHEVWLNLNSNKFALNSQNETEKRLLEINRKAFADTEEITNLLPDVLHNTYSLNNFYKYLRNCWY